MSVPRRRHPAAGFSIAAALIAAPPAFAEGTARNPHSREACIDCHGTSGKSLGPERTTIWSSREEPHAALAGACRPCHWTNYKSLVTTRPNRADAYKLFDTSERLLAAAQKMVEAIQAATGVKTGAVVNMAGRQRMLSQRMAMLHMMKIWDISDEAVEQKSQEARAQFIEAHGKLLREPRNTPEIKKNLETVANLLKLLDHSLKSKEGLTFTVATTTEKILKNMDEATRAYAELEQTSVK